MSNPNWLVRCYNAEDKIEDKFVIQERSELEALREAEVDPRVLAAEDWTMTKTKRRKLMVKKNPIEYRCLNCKNWRLG